MCQFLPNTCVPVVVKSFDRLWCKHFYIWKNGGKESSVANACTYIIIQILCERVGRNSYPSRAQIDHLFLDLDSRSLGWY
jgi:hypothetical protein